MKKKVLIGILIAIVAIAVIIILANNTRTIVINTSNSNKYTISGEIIQLHDLEQDIVRYQDGIYYLIRSTNSRQLYEEKPKYSFTELTKMFEVDYEKVCKIYDKAYKQVKDNVKITIAIEHYKNCLDTIHQGIITNELYEECNNSKYINALEELGSSGTDFTMQLISDYRK